MTLRRVQGDINGKSPPPRECGAGDSGHGIIHVICMIFDT